MNSAGNCFHHACIDIAKALTNLKSNRAVGWIHYAYALNELKRTREAFDLLAPLAGKFASDATIRFNLACYAFQLGRLKEAGEWLQKAYEAGNAREIKLQALDDPDLAPPWQNDSRQ